MADLTFGEVTAANLARCERWHPGGIADWSVADWAVAMAGEAGEVCNAVKKLRRVEDAIANISDPGRQLDTRAAAVAAIGAELADTFLYLNLLACRLGIDLAAEIVAKFNATSERYGFPERLAGGIPGLEEARAEAERLRLLIDTPSLEDFDRAVQLESAHQVERWGVDHDAGKTPYDWLWLVGQLCTKATEAARHGDGEKHKHHVITAAAALHNWHRQVTGQDTRMRPGIGPGSAGDDALAAEVAAAPDYKLATTPRPTA